MLKEFKTMCCFCGEFATNDQLINLIVPLQMFSEIGNTDNDSTQHFYSHKECFVSKLNKKMTLSDFFWEK